MARRCRIARTGLSAPAEWSFDGETLLLSPDGAPPEGYRVRELAGIGGDDYSIVLRIATGELTLSQLGGDHGPLVDALRHAWLPARADALRLAGGGQPKVFAGAISVGSAPARPFVGVVNDDALLVSAGGGDIEPLFHAFVEGVSFDDAAYAVRCRRWGGDEVFFTKLAGRSEEFRSALVAARGRLATEAGESLEKVLPTVMPAARAIISSRWLPGRVVALTELETLSPSFTAAWRASWLAALPRKAEAEAILAWAEEAFLGYGRLGAALPEPGDAEGDAADAAGADAGESVGPPHWLVARRGRRWLLEFLTATGWATYAFEAGAEMVSLASHLLCAPQFSREALFLPPERLVGERADLAVAARELPFLVALRERFRGRTVHAGREKWRSVLSP